MKLAPALVVLLLTAGAALTIAAEAPWAVPTPETTRATATFVRTYPILSPTDASTVVGNQTWRVVNGTGNGNENHVTVNATGRIIDIGGAIPAFSDDEGVTWKAAPPLGSLRPIVLGAEGSGANAPNGDWVGMTWDPQWADRIIAYKYDAGNNTWYSSHVALHTPVYDRPWIGVIPGPITIGDQTFPYISVLRGGTAAKFSFISTDGLTYVAPQAGELSPAFSARSWLDVPSGVAWADHVQPIAPARVLPLPGGGALVGADRVCSWARMNSDGIQRCWGFPTTSFVSIGPGTAPRFDSLGRLHMFEAGNGVINHRMSTDGGRTWTTIPLTLPSGAFYATNLGIDTAANGALDMAAVAIRASVGGVTKILVYKVTNLSTATPDVEILQVGNADFAFATSLGVGSTPRMDFISVGILPSGRVVTSFGDATHLQPRVAIEQS